MNQRPQVRLLATLCAHFVGIACWHSLATLATAQEPFSVSPPAVRLASPEATQQLLVTGDLAGRKIDRTHAATYEVADAKIASVEPGGLVSPMAEGRTEIIIRHGTTESRVHVEVTGLATPTPVSFPLEVIPILTKSRCNSGGCHGKAEGQNGFKLSVFGFDPAADYDALTKQARGRRVRVVTPEQSLLLEKGTAQVPHGGGQKLELGSLSYRRVLRWIHEGAEFSEDPDKEVVAIGVEPQERILAANGTQQLRVTAVNAQGERICVTAESEFESNAAALADVDRRGLVTASELPGEAAILVRYLGHVAVARMTMPRPGEKFARPAETSFIDQHVWNQLDRLSIPPSELADDATFLRRVYFDTIGTLPTAAEAREFLTSTAPDKRAKLIDALLAREEYADYWAMRWADILRADQSVLSPQGVVAITRWLRKQFAANKPYDELVREVLTVQGPTLAEGPAAVYKVLNTPELASRSISQLFLGVRIECAQCHHHPSERWGQDDYVALAGFFTGLTRKKLPEGEEAVVSRGGTDLKHPRTGELVPARGLGAESADFTGVADRRVVLAHWMTAPDNPFFAKAIANRLWAHYFGRGLVEPIDDIRATNPAANEPLMAALTQHMRDVKYDLKAFTRTLLNSRAYQLSNHTLPGNADDTQNFSHATPKSLPAEVLLDAICQVTGVPEKFNGWPVGYRAIQIWDNRMPSYFFRIFGRPVRATVCECERSNEPSISQALHLLNSPEVFDKIQFRHGAARALTDSNRPPREIVDELYLSTLSRFPTEEERALVVAAFEQPGRDRRAVVEDAMWALLNSKEFIYNH